jgi:hypothetical protein
MNSFNLDIEERGHSRLFRSVGPKRAHQNGTFDFSARFFFAAIDFNQL